MNTLAATELILHPNGTTEPLNLPRRGEFPRLIEILRMFPPLRALVFELPSGYVVIGAPYHPGLLLEYNARASALVKDCPQAVSLHGPAIVAPREVFADSTLDSDAKRMSMNADEQRASATGAVTRNATVEVSTTQERARPTNGNEPRSKRNNLAEVLRVSASERCCSISAVEPRGKNNNVRHGQHCITLKNKITRSGSTRQIFCFVSERFGAKIDKTKT
jgi:hypothetical protein